MHVLTCEYVGCYKDADSKNLVLAAGSVVGLTSYCWKVKKQALDESRRW
jgi:hypothetical protein